ncbi:FadR/GntR family transcriptional regulator [Homoserinimonas sp. OAct 916]|uniref:FadR/GntR family transcriptional regulator n=1 Tax=Homoserinimonas sp. OAct 916 TaxID=2211450 RepID=UPI0018E51D15|nr:FadR/GntR family transcriptional regulator [Homoserinimonas sp. OAct 916]
MAESITDKLIADGLKAGDKLPTEPELAEYYGVSRSVIREAGRILTERGLVDIRPGRGMTVADFDGAAISRQFGLVLDMQHGTFRQLMEMRLVMEVGMTEYAALRHTAEDMALIRTALAAFGANQGQNETLQADIDFHAAVAAASHNPFFVHLVNPVNDYLRKAYDESRGYVAAQSQTYAEHAKIADAIESRDPTLAAAAAREHLQRVLDASEDLITKSAVSS